MYCDGSITIMWSLSICIDDFPLPCRRVNNQSFQDIRLRPYVHNLSVSTFIWCWLPPYSIVNHWNH